MFPHTVDIILLLVLICNANCDTKVWTYSWNISDPLNWVDGATQKPCNGLIFAKENSGSIIIDQLRVKSLTLPKSGILDFRSNSKIIFDENSKEDLNCVKLKPIDLSYWGDFHAWNNTDDPDNPAIPYSERPPSRFDDIVLPQGEYFNMIIIAAKVKSVTIRKGNDKKQIFHTNDDKLYDLFNSYADLDIVNETCEDITGCAVEVYFGDIICRFLLPQDSVIECHDPIKPIGFCDVPKCGGSITIESLKPGFRLDRIKTKLKEYSSYTHASKISDTPSQIQIFFTEKEFSGQSVVEASEFYNLLRDDDSYYCGNIKLEMSGSPLRRQSAFVQNALSVTFGTLLGVVVMFGLLFLMYSPAFANLNIRNRLFGNRPLSTYILRYDNIEDRGYIVEGQSVAGSLLNLNRSFENPMYEATSSTRSTSNETIASVKLEGHREDTNDKSIREIDADLEEAQEMGEMKLTQSVVEDISDDTLLKDI